MVWTWANYGLSYILSYWHTSSRLRHKSIIFHATTSPINSRTNTNFTTCFSYSTIPTNISIFSLNISSSSSWTIKFNSNSIERIMAKWWKNNMIVLFPIPRLNLGNGLVWLYGYSNLSREANVLTLYDSAVRCHFLYIHIFYILYL